MRTLLTSCALGLILLSVPVLAAAQAVPARAVINDFKLSGNTLLSAQAIDAALAPYLGERSMAELKQAAAAVQALYRQAGYGAVVVFVPEQTLSGGSAAITVLEGRIARITVLGQQRVSAEQVRGSLPALQEGRTPQVRRLDAQMQLANENPTRQLALVLEPGQKPGEVDANISVTERAPQQWTLSVDNTGNKQTGHTRATIGWRHGAPWGRDDQFSVQYQTSLDKPGAVSILSVNYSMPLYAQGMRLDAFAAHSDVDGGSTTTVAGPLQFVGRGNVLGLRLATVMARLGEFDQRVTLGLDRREYLNDCSIVGLPAGACGPAGESVAVSPLTLEYALQGGGDQPMGMNLALSRNLDLGGRYTRPSHFDAVRAGAPQGYTMLRVSLFANRTLPRGWRLQARLNGQLSPDALVPGEQFGIAGANTVRGYAERELIGDSAWLANLELAGPELSGVARGSLRSLRVLGFVDGAVASNRLDTECLAGRTRCSVSAVGLGLRAAGTSWQLRADLAYPLRDGNRTEKHAPKLHLAASVAFE